MERHLQFVAFLRRLDRKALAELRRSLAFDPGTYPRVFPYVEPFISRESERRSFYLLAGLFALHPDGGGSLGTDSGSATRKRTSLGEVVAQLYAQRDRSRSIEQRFITLLDADQDQLPHRLRQMISLLKAEQIPVDWGQLLGDLLYWASERRTVQQRWARDFYRVSESAIDNATEKEGGS